MENGMLVLIWAVPLMLLLHLLTLEISRLFEKWLDSDAAVISALLAFGLACFAGFWAYYLSRWAGIAFSTSIGMLLLFSVLWRIFKLRGFRTYLESGKLLWPVTTIALLVLFAGLYPFPPDWAEWSWPAHRWLDLPVDNWLPRMFADQVWAGAVKSPMTGDWLSSDRPPLQAGAYLLFKPLAPNIAGIYQVVATWLQCTMLVPFILILRTMGLLRRTGILAILVISTCPSFIINSVFVWPKLLAAAYAGICYLGLFPPAALRSEAKVRIFWIAAGSALAMLSHGGAIFAIIGSLAAYLILERRQGLGLLVRAMPLSFLVYLPWLLYQKFIDPPGDRLLSYHLAGEEHPNGRPFSELLRHAYSSTSFDQWWDSRVANIDKIFHGSVKFLQDMGHLVSHALHGEFSPKAYVVNSFFYLGYSLGFFTGTIALVALVRASFRGGIPQSSFKPLLVSTAIACAVWALLMFVRESTSLHQGSYFCAFSALVLSMALVRAWGVAVFRAISTINITLCAALFIFDRQLTFPRASGFTFDPVYIVVACLLLAAHYLACRAVVAGFRPESADPANMSVKPPGESDSAPPESAALSTV